MISLEERIQKLESLIRRISSDVKSETRVSLPAKVTSFDPGRQTISCIPTIREMVNINGSVSYRDLPELRDVPIIMPRAGNWLITLPIKVGDECMVVFQDLCIDGWWFRGGIQNWNDLRRHDLSDAIAIFSPWSQPNTVSSYSSENMEIRSLDGSIKISLTQSGINIEAPQGLNINGNVNVTGDVQVSGAINSTDNIKSDADVLAGSISLKSHTHNYNPGPGATTPTGAPQ